jgi:hypothetical protein
MKHNIQESIGKTIQDIGFGNLKKNMNPKA